MADHFRTELDWEDVRFFAALSRHGSLSAAARALGVNHATVSRRIAGLEHSLGAKLFERRPAGYELTAPGRNALETVEAMENAAQHLVRSNGTDAIAGLVRITAPPTLADAFLIPRLATLSKIHSALDLEVVSDIRALSLPRFEADIALRLARPQDGDLIARRSATLRFGFFATLGWENRISAGEAPVFVGFDEANGHLPEAKWLARHFPKSRLAFRTNSQISQAEAARAGWGVALLPLFLGLTKTDLSMIPMKPQPPHREIWLLTRRDVAVSKAIRVTTDFLIDVFRQESGFFCNLASNPAS